VDQLGAEIARISGNNALIDGDAEANADLVAIAPTLMEAARKSLAIIDPLLQRGHPPTHEHMLQLRQVLTEAVLVSRGQRTAQEADGIR